MEAVDGTRGLVPRNAWIVDVLMSAVVARNLPTYGVELERAERLSPVVLKREAFERARKGPSPAPEGSPEPRVDSEAPREPPAVMERPRMAKPPLQRPIVQKRS